MARFAENVSMDEIKVRIMGLLEGRVFTELSALLNELHIRKEALKARIILEMTRGRK